MLSTVILIVVMLLLSAFFSGMEIAFTSKNRLKLEIDRKQHRMFDQIAEVFARHPGQYITTILVGNNIALVVYSLSMSLLLRSIYASLGWEQLARSGSVAVDTAVSTVIIIFFAEFLPKSIFRNNPNFYYRALAPVIWWRVSRRCFPTAFCTFWAAASRSGTSLRVSTARTLRRCSTRTARSSIRNRTTS